MKKQQWIDSPLTKGRVENVPLLLLEVAFVDQPVGEQRPQLAWSVGDRVGGANNTV